jgi:hypothetical protein
MLHWHSEGGSHQGRLRGRDREKGMLRASGGQGTAGIRLLKISLLPASQAASQAVRPHGTRLHVRRHVVGSLLVVPVALLSAIWHQPVKAVCQIQRHICRGQGGWGGLGARAGR